MKGRTGIHSKAQKVENMPIFVVVGGTGIEPVTPAV
jgi:hypothetical protein